MNNLELTPSLRSFLKQWEGVRLTVYRDVAGLPTVGIGHLVRPEDKLKVGDTITAGRADSFFTVDGQTAVNAVNKYVKVPLTEGQGIALVSFIFNLGQRTFLHSHLLAYLNQGNYKAAANELPKFCHAAGKVVPGLVHRRAAERALFLP